MSSLQPPRRSRFPSKPTAPQPRARVPRPTHATSSRPTTAALAAIPCRGAGDPPRTLTPHERSPGHGHRDRVRHLGPGPAHANPMVASPALVNAYAGPTAAGPAGALGLRGGVAAARRPRLRHVPRGGRPQPAHRRGPRPRQRDPHQRRPAVRRPRAPRVLHTRVHQPARHRASGTRRGSRWASTPAGSRHARRGRPRALQEQHRQQGRVVRRPRELPDAALHAVRRHRAAPDAVLRQPPGRVRRRPGRHRAGRPRATASRSASAPTTSRSRSGWRPRSSGRSSTPATSRTPTRRSTAGCT